MTHTQTTYINCIALRAGKKGASVFGKSATGLTLGTYLILLSIKQSGIIYHFSSLWYDMTWDSTQVSRDIVAVHLNVKS